MTGGPRSSQVPSRHPGSVRAATSLRLLGQAAIATVLVGGALLGLSLAVAGRDAGGAGAAPEDRRAIDSSAEYWRSTQLPSAVPRPDGLSPFGDAPVPGYRGPADRAGLVATAIGYVDLKAPDALERALPPRCATAPKWPSRAPPPAMAPPAGPRRPAAGSTPDSTSSR